MRIVIVFSLFFGLPFNACQAAFTDFSDFTQNVTFETGETFQSNGLSFEAIELQPLAGNVKISVGFGFSQLLMGKGVAFLLPAGVQEVSLAYTDGAGSNIAINGMQPMFPVGVARLFSLVDGTTLAGVSIETTLFGRPPSSSFEEGILTLRGPITSLAIAGIELSIDDVSVIVPEPSTATLLLAASISLLTRRRQNV